MIYTLFYQVGQSLDFSGISVHFVLVCVSVCVCARMDVYECVSA